MHAVQQHPIYVGSVRGIPAPNREGEREGGRANPDARDNCMC
jgi:hypothetical protein